MWPTPTSARDPATTMRRMLAGVKIREGETLDATGFSAPDPDAGFVDRMPEPDGLPDWLSQEELDFYIAEFSPHRVHRRRELVSQLRPQLGASPSTSPA